MSFESEMIARYESAKAIVDASDEYDNTDHSKTKWMNDKIGARPSRDSVQWRREISESKDFLMQYGDYCKRLISIKNRDQDDKARA